MSTYEERKLAKRAADTQYQLEQDRRRRKAIQERWDVIHKAKLLAPQSFWCDACEQDFSRIGCKVVQLYDPPVALRATTCPECNSRCVRYITDKIFDPYWTRSLERRIDHDMHEADALQPGQHGFDTHYPNSFAQFVKEQTEKEDKIFGEYVDPSTRLSRSKDMRRKMREADYRNA